MDQNKKVVSHTDPKVVYEAVKAMRLCGYAKKDAERLVADALARGGYRTSTDLIKAALTGRVAAP